LLESPVGASADQEGRGQEQIVPSTGEPPAGSGFPVNGGFPEPPPGEPVRVVHCLHECGAETAVRIPASLPAEVVQRVICSGCGAELRAFDPVELRQRLEAKHAGTAAAVADTAAGETAAAAAAVTKPKRPRRRIHLSNRAWQLISVPLVAGVVIAALVLLNGDDKTPLRRVVSTASAPSATGQATVSGDAHFIHAGNYSLALPPGWKTVAPHGGAVFRAVAGDGSADATLWIERNPTLTFAQFQSRSLANLKSLAGDASVHRRLPAPSGSGTIVQLRADVPTGSGTSPYLVTLRAAGPYRYYLATSVQPGASQDVRGQAALIHGSFTPEAGPATRTGGTP
jgi:hypothetical protein